ncbi:MAG: hypothetical protein AB7O65_09830 [Candidatus Korobacteraceae bacterium]
MIVETKRQAYALYHGGKFGNKLRTWDSVRDFAYSGHAGPVTMRYKGTVTGKAWYAYNVPASEVAARAKVWIAEGADPMLIVVNESAPDESLVVQGELIHTHRGYCFIKRFDKVKMRVAMTASGQPDEVVGIVALTLLRHVCTGSSFEDLMELCELYPDSVIEFSVYDHCLGSCRGRNMLVWEVRNY